MIVCKIVKKCSLIEGDATLQLCNLLLSLYQQFNFKLPEK